MIEWVDYLTEDERQRFVPPNTEYTPPWKVTDVELSVDSGEVKAFIEQ